MKLFKQFGVLVTVSVLSFFLISCGDQTDNISIKKDGTISFASTFIFSTASMSQENWDIAANGLIDDIIQANWKVSSKWISKAGKTIQYEVNGSANLKTMTSAISSYSIAKKSDTNYQLTIITVPSGETDKRTVNFSYPSNVKVTDSAGKAVKTINILSDEKVIIDIVLN